MSYGAPDFYQYALTSQFAAQAGLGELAARLGGLALLDRRGDVIWADTFAYNTSRWYLGGTATTKAIALSEDYVEHGQYSAYLTMTGGANKNAWIRHTEPRRSTSRWGLASFYGRSDECDYFEIALRVSDGSQMTYFAARHSYDADTLQYLDENGDYQTIPDWSPNPGGAGEFNFLKLVINPAALEYVRILQDDFSVNLPGITGRNDGGTLTTRQDSTLEIGYNSPFATGVYIDSVIFTIHEPA